MAMGIWLPGGGGADLDVVTAAAGDVLAGKVIVDKDGEPLAGTMPERGAWSSSELSAGASVTIPAGHHSGSGKVTAKSLASQTSGTAAAAQILSGETAWVNGAEVTGSMANRGAYNGAGNSRGNDTGNKRMWVKVPGGYYNENAQVFLSWNDIKNYLGITADKIKKGVTIMDITGTHEGYVTSPLYLLNDGEWSNLQTTGFTATVGSVSYNKDDKDYYFDGIARTNQAVNLSSYNYLKGDLFGGRYNGKDYDVVLGVSTSANLTTENFSASYKGHSGTFVVNVSNLTGNYFIYVSALNAASLGRPSVSSLFLTSS